MKEKFWIKIAWLLPKNLIYWATIRLWANATQGEWAHVESPAVTISDAVKRWE